VIARAARSSTATATRERGGARMAAECQPAHPNGVPACGERDFPGQCSYGCGRGFRVGETRRPVSLRRQAEPSPAGHLPGGWSARPERCVFYYSRPPSQRRCLPCCFPGIAAGGNVRSLWRRERAAAHRVPAAGWKPTLETLEERTLLSLLGPPLRAPPGYRCHGKGATGSSPCRPPRSLA
jgi:hypothetical protein